jgi:hypothetical protein
MAVEIYHMAVEIYQMALEICIPNISNKLYQNLDLLYASVSSGNPGRDTVSRNLIN